MSDGRSVTRWFRELEGGSDAAASELWRRYFRRLVGLARKQMGAAERRTADEEDVALSVFRCLFDGAARGQFANLVNRDELWRLLVRMTRHKVIDHARFTKQQKRGGGRVRGDEALASPRDGHRGSRWDRLPYDFVTPDLLAILAEQHERLMSLLEAEGLRDIALWKLEGHTNQEIAQRIGLTCRSVERKLQRIRRVWARECEA
jgi:DNA-directed RNA polymerase specialized sigma24 family protein